MGNSNLLVRKRITSLFFIVAAILFFLIGRLAWIQFVNGTKLQKMAMENRTRDVPVEAKRGTIYDRNGKELVRSISADSIFAEPKRIKKPREVAHALAGVLGQNEETLYQKLTLNKWFVWVDRKITDSEKIKKIKEMDLQGIRFVEESLRSYPHGKMASHIFGFVNMDNIGANGIELSHDKELRGEPGYIVMEYDAVGQEIPQARHHYIPPKDGSNLVLTIDSTIQHFVERELDEIMQKRKAKAATIIVMDPKTGEILGMGNRPDFDPNEYGKYPKESWNNRAIWMNYEPGSTFKVVTASAALEEGVVKRDTPFDDPGYAMVDGERIRCWYDGGHGHQSFIEVVQNSCNPGFIKVGLSLGKQRFFKYIRAFGFGRQTGIDLPGEAEGLLYAEKEATNLNIATMSIGQSISVTPIQLVNAVSTIANGGNYIKPHLVKEVRSTDDKTVQKIEPDVVRQVLAEDTARELREILESVVVKGSGKNAAVKGYRVAGKTGTAQKAGPNGGYMDGKVIGSFLGFTPVEDPRLAILVIVDEPEGIHFGSQVAAPHFAAIARDALIYMGVPPRVPVEKKEPGQEKSTVIVPSVINSSLKDAQDDLKAEGFKIRTSGSGNLVYNQQPKSGVRVPQGSEVILYLADNLRQVKPGTTVTMPDVTGLSMREAARYLAITGLYMKPEGSGVAVEQSIKPGTKVQAGAEVIVKFVSPVKEDRAPPTLSSP